MLATKNQAWKRFKTVWKYRYLSIIGSLSETADSRQNRHFDIMKSLSYNNLAKINATDILILVFSESADYKHE